MKSFNPFQRKTLRLKNVSKLSKMLFSCKNKIFLLIMTVAFKVFSPKVDISPVNKSNLTQPVFGFAGRRGASGGVTAGGSRGTDVAEAISLLILQLTRDVEGARGRGLE